MRLTVLGPGHPFRGGIATTTTALVQALLTAGHEVRFLTPRRQYPRWLFPGRDDRDPAACPAVPGAEAVLDPMWPPSWPWFRRRTAAGPADAWLLPFWTWAWAGWWRYLLGAPDRPPAVAVVHNPVDHDGGLLRRLAARRVLGRCEALFTHGRALAAELEGTYPGRPVGTCPLPPTSRFELPARAAARRRLGLDGDRRIALFLGLVRPYKGVELLVEALARLGPDDRDWFLVVAGEPWGGAGETLAAAVAAAGVADRVRLNLRWVPEDELPILLAAADLAVLPYRSASQSAVAPIALAHGVPVLATAVGALPELVRDGVNGRVVEPGSAAALAAALAELDGERLAVLAAAAPASVPSWADYAGRLMAVVAEVTGRG